MAGKGAETITVKVMAACQRLTVTMLQNFHLDLKHKSDPRFYWSAGSNPVFIVKGKNNIFDIN